MSRVVVAIAAPLDSALAMAIGAVDDRLEVRYLPDLLPQPRCSGDHVGVQDFRRTPAQEDRWRGMLADAEVVYGVPGESVEGLTDLIATAPALRWVQSTSDRVLTPNPAQPDGSQVTVTYTAGIRVTSSAEFVMFGVLAAARGLPGLLTDNAAHRWSPHPARQLAGQTLLLIGLGPAAVEVSRLATAFGMEVCGVNRTGRANIPNINIVRPTRFLGDLLPASHAVVVSLPRTPEAIGLIGTGEIARMRRDAVLVGIGDGGVIDEHALIEGLRAGQPAAAVLDVPAGESLPSDSPLWTMPNVLVSTQTAALSNLQDRRVVERFIQNLTRYLRGEELTG